MGALLNDCRSGGKPAGMHDERAVIAMNEM